MVRHTPLRIFSRNNKNASSFPARIKQGSDWNQLYVNRVSNQLAVFDSSGFRVGPLVVKTSAGSIHAVDFFDFTKLLHISLFVAFSEVTQ